jgi:2-amino-4-hydroxy-6-hydroxymethyldihydropteridine diphosphokinase
MGMNPGISTSQNVQAIVALGGNLGDVRANFVGARDMLAAQDGISLLASSRLYHSTPMGPQDQPDYLNAVVMIRSRLSPLALLHELQTIESHFGRTRDGLRWGERTLDLDLIAYDDIQMQTSGLTLPHPGMQERVFVLQPLCDILPAWQHPVTGKTADNMLQKQILAGQSPLGEGEVW